MFTLLDKEQKTPWQDQPLIYRMKWRIYVRDNTVAKLAEVTQFNWGGMASPTEYDVPACAAGVHGCVQNATLNPVSPHWVHSMNGTWHLGQMSNANRGPQKLNGSVAFKTIHGHCHAPTCIVFTVYIAKTMEVLCEQRAAYGNSNKTFNEAGYLDVPPCVFGDADQGLNSLRALPLDTQLFSIKHCKANYGHHGEMSLWQTYGVYGK